MRSSLVALAALLLASCYVPGRGFVESEFDLVLESRFPKFFHPPANAKLSDYRVRVIIYSSPLTERIVIRDRYLRTVFDETCPFRWHPNDTYQGRGQIVYPSHNVVSFPSGEDILEQRAPEPKFFLTDDKALWEAITKAPNHAMQPTAGRRTVLLSMTKTRSFQIMLGLASGG